jgi:hypothetical protein
MKRICAHKKRGSLVIALILGWQLLTGTGFFCVNQYPHAFRSAGSARTAHAGTTAVPDDGSAGAWNNVAGQSGKVPCSCKKKKKCPTIPRTTLISNPTHRFNEEQRQVRTACGESLVLNGTDRCFAFGSAPPFVKLAWGMPVSSSPHLSITCVLLI